MRGIPGLMKRKVWFALGTATLVAAPLLNGARPSAARPQGHPILVAQAGEGGERSHRNGGPAAEDSDIPRNLRLLRDLHLIRGHLLAADELIRESRWPAALSHCRHAEVMHSGMGKDLNAYGLASLATTLQAIVRAVRARNKSDYETALAKLQQSLDGADGNVRMQESNWPAFVVETVLELLRNAAAEYDQAIENGRIVRAIEYQDARGIALEAEKLFATVAEPLAVQDADAVRAARMAFTELHKAWPAPVPPRIAARETSAVISDMSRIELQIGRFR
ncbi:MAG: hypothetical protein ACJ8DX_18930 [Xanthobacteraceae bacterium]